MRNETVGAASRDGRRSPFFFVVLSAALALPAGLACNRSDPARAAEQSPASQGEAGRISLARVDEAGIAAAVERHKGKVVILDVWATWCGPCVETFPRLPKWLEKYGDDRLAVVTVSLDDEEDVAPKVDPFLREQQTERLDLLLYTAGDHDKMVNSIDPDWAGEVPALFLYDKMGRLAASLTGEHEAAEVEEQIEKLL